jgi:HNH endonuclease
VERLATNCHCGDHAWFALTNGYVALVDPDMATLAACWCWSADEDRGAVYVRRTNSVKVNGRRLVWSVRLHQQIMCLPQHWKVDHANGNGLDNRRSNLRPATEAENCANRKKVRSKLGLRGVVQRGNRFLARIAVNQRVKHLGTFKQADAAARAYDQAAREHYGEFARLNFETTTGAIP